MAERESDQVRLFGNEPADDFPSESNLPLSVADVSKTRRVLHGGQVVLITLTSTDEATNEFLSERDVPGYDAGPILEIVPVESALEGSLTDTVTASSTEARAAIHLDEKLEMAVRRGLEGGRRDGVRRAFFVFVQPEQCGLAGAIRERRAIERHPHDPCRWGGRVIRHQAHD